MDGYKKHLEESGRTFELMPALEIIGADANWFVDERTLDMIQLHKFYGHRASEAFQVPFHRQPAIWVYAKTMLDQLLKEQIL